MSDHVQEAFGLSRRPFDKGVDAGLLWMDGGRQAALPFPGPTERDCSRRNDRAW